VTFRLFCVPPMGKKGLALLAIPKRSVAGWPGTGRGGSSAMEQGRPGVCAWGPLVQVKWRAIHNKTFGSGSSLLPLTT